jgi:single-strand DNA-binding protein
MTYHKLILVGRLGADVDLRFTPNGQAVANFSIATDRSYRTAEDEQVKITTWFKISVWGKMPESCNTYLHKGSLCLVEGVLNPDKETGRPKIWTSADGRQGTSYDVNADTVRFLDSKKSTENEQVDENENQF